MSDYEDEGWTPIELSVRRDASKVSSYGFTGHVVPKGQLISDLSAKHDPDTRRSKRSLQPQRVKSFHPEVQPIRPRVYHGTGGRPAERLSERPPLDDNSPSLQLYKQTPNNPIEIYQLDVAWKSLLRSIPETQHTRSRDIARNNLDRISVHSEAFIKTPDEDSVQVEIWGTKEQCLEAKTRLRAWESHLRSTGPRPSRQVWTKERAFDGRREDRQRQALWQDLEDQAIQDADDSDFEYEAYLIWPKDYDLDAYIHKYEGNTLKEIGKEFHCRFRHQSQARPRQTRVQAKTEGDLLSAYQRLINLAKEMIAPRNRGTHGNFCRLPSPSAYRDRILVEKVANYQKAPWRIIPFGIEMTDSEAGEWLVGIPFYEKQNRKELQSSIDTFLKGLFVSQCHIRLRVSFGDLLLRSFLLPRGEPSFTFDDFLAIMANQRTEFTEPLLLNYIGDIDLLLDQLSSMEEFQNPEQSYRQLFEFKGSDSTSRLRLEIEMQNGYDFDEPQVCSQRWLAFKTYGQNENVLGLRMFDFERPGYMIRADAYELYTNENHIRDMEAFQRAVGYRPSPEGIKAPPKLRSTFPSHERLMTVTEFVSTKFQFKDTDGIIEIRREDLFSQEKGDMSVLPDNTRFELFYYYPEWDNLLGELSTIKPGEDISWYRDVHTFFPKHFDPDRPRSLPRGFKTFMKEVHEIQDLVKVALSKPGGIEDV